MRCVAATWCCCCYLLSSPTPSWGWVVCIGGLDTPPHKDIRRLTTNTPFCSVSCRLNTCSSLLEGGGDKNTDPLKETTHQLALSLSDAVRLHLDGEWMPRDGHAQIAKRVELAYKHAVLENGAVYVTDIVRAIADDLQGHECMNKVNLEGRDIADICSDFLLKKIGLKLDMPASYSVQLPTKLTEGKQEKLAGADVEPGKIINCTAEEMRNLMSHLNSSFSRYRWISQVIEGEISWREVNVVVAIMKVGASVVASSPVANLKKDNAALEDLQEILPESEDSVKELDEFIEHIYGKESKRMAEASCNLEYAQRSIAVKFLYTKGFLNDEFYSASKI